MLNERMRSWGCGRSPGLQGVWRGSALNRAVTTATGDHEHCTARCVINPTHEENVTNVALCLELPQIKNTEKSKHGLFRIVRRKSSDAYLKLPPLSSVMTSPVSLQSHRAEASAVLLSFEYS